MKWCSNLKLFQLLAKLILSPNYSASDMRGKKGKGLVGTGCGTAKGRGLSSNSEPWDAIFNSYQGTPPITLTPNTKSTIAAVVAPVTAPTIEARIAPAVAPVTAPTTSRRAPATASLTAPTSQATITPITINVAASPPLTSHEQAAATTSSPPINTSVEVDDSNGTPRARSDSATFDGCLITPKFMVITHATTDGEGEFYPIQISHKVSEAITKTFREKLVKEGWKWKLVPNSVKGFYWKEFKKQFRWDPEIEGLVRGAWLKRAASRYRDMICKWKKQNRPEFIDEDVWNAWHDATKTSNYVKISKQAFKNRKTEVAGEGTGPSKHSGGSIKFSEHARRMKKKDAEQKEPSKLAVFLYMHTPKDKRGDPSQFIDKRSQAVFENFKRLKQTTLENIEEGSNQDDSVEVDDDLLFIEAAGGKRKNRIYGLGSVDSASYGSSSINVSSSSAQQEEINKLNERQSKLENLVVELIKEMKQDREESRQWRASFARPPPRDEFEDIGSPNDDYFDD